MVLLYALFVTFTLMTYHALFLIRPSAAWWDEQNLWKEWVIKTKECMTRSLNLSFFMYFMALSQSPSLPKRRTTKGFGGTYMTKLRLKSRWTTVGKIYYWISLKIHVQLMLFSQTRRVQSGGRELRPPCGQEGHHQDEVRQGALLVPVLLNSWCFTFCCEIRNKTVHSFKNLVLRVERRS